MSEGKPDDTSSPSASRVVPSSVHTFGSMSAAVRLCVHFDVNETTASEPGSGDFYGSGDLNGTVEPPEPNTDFIQDLWNWRWPWE